MTVGFDVGVYVGVGDELGVGRDVVGAGVPESGLLISYAP